MKKCKLTPTQHDAYELIKAKGKWFPYNGISRATIRVLEREGLVQVEWSVQTWRTHRTGRFHSLCDWVAKPVTSD